MWVDTTGAGKDLVLVGSGDLIDAGERIDYATNVERFFGSLKGINTIDLSGATVDTTLEFSKYSKLHSNELDEPNGNATGAADLTRGILLRGSADGTAYATFVDRTKANPTGQSYWTQVQGSSKAETVIFTDNEMNNGQTYTLKLGGGLNVVDYSPLNTAPAITAHIGGVNTKDANLSQAVSINATQAIIQQYHAGATGRDGNLLTVVGSGHGDTVDIALLDKDGVAASGSAISGKYFSSYVNTPAGVPAELIYNLVDLSAQKVVEAVNGYADNVALGFVTQVKGFSNIDNTKNTLSGHLYGDGTANTIKAGDGGDWLYGGAGSSGDGKNAGGDQLIAGAGSDRFIYKGESESPAGFRARIRIRARSRMLPASPGPRTSSPASSTVRT